MSLEEALNTTFLITYHLKKYRDKFQTRFRRSRWKNKPRLSQRGEAMPKAVKPTRCGE